MTFEDKESRFDDSDDDDRDGNPWNNKKKSQFVFKLERDFGYEIQEYISLRREIIRRK